MWLILGFLGVILAAIIGLLSVSRGALSSEMKWAHKMTKAEREELFKLFEVFFEREFVDFEDFDGWLLKDHEVFLFRKRSDRSLQGFIIVKSYDRMIDGVSFKVLHGEFFAVTRQFRLNAKPIMTLLYWCFISKLKNPRGKMYYFFLTYSYKSYLSFGRSMGVYYPCHFTSTPPFEKKVIDLLGSEASLTPHEWGVYDPQNCVVKDKFEGERGSLKLSSSFSKIPEPQGNLSNTMEFFISQNPGHIRGDCFCVCCPISWFNFYSGAQKIVLRALGKKKTQTKHKAFGIGVRKDDQVGASPTTFRINHFKVNVPQNVLFDLRAKLELWRAPDQIENANWEYGTELNYMKEFVAFWKTDFDWKEKEAALNLFPQWKTKIDGIQIHFIHVKSKVSNAFPLLLLHGWPGTPFDFYKIVEPLIDPEMHGGSESQAFHLVIPSIPGYAWSEAPQQAGYDVKKVAQCFKVLMARLGYSKYGAQGGDWGGLISSYLALEDPQHCVGIHLNLVLADLEPQNIFQKLRIQFDYIFQKWRLNKDEIQALERMERWEEEEFGYAAIQMTKPQTLGYALADSPVGLAAWIIEKYRGWGDCKGNVESRFSKNDLLTTVMIYWITNCITSSFRLYYETAKNKRWKAPEHRVEVPVACAIFPAEIFRVPRAWAEAHYNIQRWTVMPAGGHWPALEEPDLLCNDLREFFATLRK